MIPQGHMSEEESRAWIRGANSDTSLRTYGKDRSIDGPGNGGGGFIESRGGIRCVRSLNRSSGIISSTYRPQRYEPII